MKKYILCLLALYIIGCKNEKTPYNTRIEGTTKKVKDSTKIYLTDFYFGDTDGFVDSTYIINNKFSFNFNLQEPRSFQLNGVNTSAKHLLLNSGITSLNIPLFDSIHKLTIEKSSATTLEQEAYFKKNGYEFNIDYVKKNPNKATSLKILWEQRFNLPIDTLKSNYNLLTDKWKYTTAANDIEKLLKNKYNPVIGELFQDFELKDANDSIISLNNFKNKYLLIEFTATWCGPCMQQIPFQKSAYEKYKDKGLEILHIYIENKDIMKANVKKHEIPWTSVYAPKKFRSEVALNNRVYYLPNMFVLDKNHKIIATTLNPLLLMDGFENFIEKTIKD